jgi:hypothetical protein
MRVLLASVLLLGVIARAPAVHACCTTGQLSVLPWIDVPLPTRGRLVLTGSGVYADEVGKLGARAPRLVSAEEEVALHVEVTSSGSDSMISVLLVPERPLRPEVEYSLFVSAPTASQHIGEAPTIYRRTGASEAEDHHPLRWRTTCRSVDPVRWLAAPVVKWNFVAKEFADLDRVELSTDVGGRRGLLAFEVRVARNASAKPEARFFADPTEDRIELGWLGCDWNADLVPGRSYVVRIVPITLEGEAATAVAVRLVAARRHEPVGGGR